MNVTPRQRAPTPSGVTHAPVTQVIEGPVEHVLVRDFVNLQCKTLLYSYKRLSKIKRDCPRKVPFVMICYLPTAFKVTLLHRFESSLKTDDDMLFTHRFQGNITS